ncbi:TlpA family protein disulfide reductase [Olivibacter sp. SDN3]|uniref:peroxiredoxin family protein n=1 Tax=Olivibacter sp. SDN3 TaxID=2764720 RepID=UPI001651094B|nr:TlpA disulfide reductase family protein [Olivibacter sp. SDN3]QNL51857.1 TlpA family protein disulfide reductase [Olivibacter sp. SDN3]
MIKYLLLLSAFLLFFNPKTTKAQDAKPFKVVGSIDTVPGASYYVDYRYNPDSLVYDTVNLDENGHFILSGYITEPTTISLSIDNIYDKNYLGNWRCYSFWVEPDKEIYFEGLRGFDKQIVRNSETQRLSEELRLKAEPLSTQLASLDKKIRSNAYTEEDRRVYDSLARERDEMNIQFIDTHPNTFFAASLLHGYIRNDPSFYARGERLYNKLTPEVKATKKGQVLQELLRKQLSVQLGEQLEDFSLADTAGNSVSLSNYKGKYVLVEFWASWCTPCRRENPNLVKSYNEYKSKGFEILAVSFDQKQEDWINAIREDGLPWTHVSELQNLWNSAIAKKLLVTSVPDNFLLDREGRIIGRNLRGEELNQKLDTITAAD